MAQMVTNRRHVSILCSVPVNDISLYYIGTEMLIKLTLVSK